MRGVLIDEHKPLGCSEQQETLFPLSQIPAFRENDWITRMGRAQAYVRGAGSLEIRPRSPQKLAQLGSLPCAPDTG